jgi:hypothetical protein
MKVLFLTHYFPPEGNAPASRVHEMCKRWVRDGHEVTVITCAPNCPAGVVYDGYRNRLHRRETVDGIEVRRVWTYIAPNKGTVRRVLNYVSYMLSAITAAMFVRKPDVLIATSPQFFCGIAGMVAQAVRRVPFVLEVRDIWPESIATVGAMRKGLALRVLEWLERRMYASADHVVTVGDGYRQQLGERGVPDEKMSVVTNGVDNDLFAPRDPDPAFRAQYKLDGRFACAYVGTIGMASGLDVALRAGRLLKDKGRDDIALLLVGDGAERQRLQAEADQADLDNVIFTGRLDKSQMPTCLASVDACLVHLKRKDLFKYVLPSKIFEAAAMRRPIILGVEGFAADLVQQAGAGLCIEPENAEHLVAAIERLADDRALAARLGESGRQYVTKHFNRDALSRDYLAVLHRVVAGDGAAAAAVEGIA